MTGKLSFGIEFASLSMIFRLNLGAVLEMWHFFVFFILFYQFFLSTARVSSFLEFKFSWIYNIQRNINKTYIITILIQVWNTTLFQKRVMRTKFDVYVFMNYEIWIQWT